MKSDFLIAVTQLAAERNLPREVVYSAIEAALISAYKKDNLAAGQDISVKLNPADGEIKVYARKTVVEKVEDELNQMSVKEARRHKPDAQIADVIELETEDYNAGRIAAQTAKQVVMQRLREAERELVYAEYIEREGDILNATVQRVEPKQVILDLGRAEAVLPVSEQVPSERYRPNQRVKVYLLEVQRTSRGPEVIVSRAHRNLLKRLFELEVPEIFHGSVEIMAIAREPGSRSKVAVAARQEGVDPVGSCVGLRGIRIQNIVNELQGEKIDVVQWHNDPAVFIGNALSPAQVLRVETNQADGVATVVVSDRYLSLAIGREGQNARLAAKLTGWKVDIKSSLEFEAARAQHSAAPAASRPETTVAEAKQVAIAETPPAPAKAAPEQKAVVAGAVSEVKSPEEALLEEALKAEEGSQPEVSAEETLLGETTKAAAGPQAAVVELEVEEEEEEEEKDVWVLPAIPQESSGIRFAEDIMGGRMGRGGGRGGRRRGGQQQDGEVARKGKGKGRRSSVPSDDQAPEGAN